MLKAEFLGYTPVERPEINCDNVILAACETGGSLNFRICQR